MFKETASPTRLYLSLKPYGAASKQPLRLSASSTRLWYYLKPYIAACKQLWRETASPSRPSLSAWDWLQSSWPPSTNTPLTAMLTGIHNKFLNRSNRLKKGLSDWFLTLIHHENLFRYLKYQHNLTRSLSQTKKDIEEEDKPASKAARRPFPMQLHQQSRSTHSVNHRTFEPVMRFWCPSVYFMT